jgi:exopolysaccharide production protein ExoQ
MTTFAYAALWLFCFAVPWENVVFIPGVGTISKLIGMGAFGLALLATVVTGRVRRVQGFHVAALLFVMWAGVNAFQTADEGRALIKAGTYFQLLVVLWMIWELAPDFRRQRGLLLAYVCGAYVSAINTVMEYREGLHISRAASRFAAEGFDANDLGMTLALAVPMAWYLGMTYRQPFFRWLCRAYVPLALVAIGLTASRGALIASIVALLIVPLTMSQVSRGKMVMTILLVVASGAIAVAYIPATSWQRFGTTRSEVEGGTLNDRLVIWKAAMKAFTKRPFVGYGTNGFNWAVHSQPHNSYLAVLVEEGIVGFALYGLMFLAVLIKILRLPPMERRFGLILFATLGIAMLPLGWENRKPVWFILAALLGFSQAVAAGTGGVVRQARARNPVRFAGASPAARLRPAPTASVPTAERDATA